MATRRYGITVLHVVLLCNLTDSGQFVWWCLLHQVGHNKGENRKQTLMTSTSSPVLQWKHVSMYVPVQQWQFHIQTTHTHTHTHRLTHKHTHTHARARAYTQADARTQKHRLAHKRDSLSLAGGVQAADQSKGAVCPGSRLVPVFPASN